MPDAPLPIWAVTFDDGYVVNVVSSTESGAREIASLAYPGSVVATVLPADPEKL